jgi:hypothetical protein
MMPDELALADMDIYAESIGLVLEHDEDEACCGMGLGPVYM